MYCAIYDYCKDDYLNNDYIKEVIYNYNDYTLLEKLSMTKENPHLTFVFSVVDVEEEDIDNIVDLCATRDNIKIMGDFKMDFSDKEFPFFYHSEAIFVDTLDVLDSICRRGVSDVYVTGALGFDMKNAKKIADKYNVQIRVIANKAQYPRFQNESRDDLVTSFWIRPEDLTLYEEYVGIVEFKSIPEKQPVLYDIYMVDQRWRASLGILIVGLGDLDNRGILDGYFTVNRLNCGKKCLLGNCNKCYRYKHLSQVLKENGLKIEDN